MFQDILALLTVAGAVFYTIRGLYRAVTVRPDEPNNFCSGCTVGSCPIKSEKVAGK